MILLQMTKRKPIKKNNWPTLWNCGSNKLYMHMNIRKKCMQLRKDSKLLKLFLRAYSIHKAKLNFQYLNDNTIYQLSTNQNYKL